MDVHKRTIAVSVRFPGEGFDERTIPHEARSVIGKRNCVFSNVRS
jgi:hypothetical protein